LAIRYLAIPIYRDVFQCSLYAAFDCGQLAGIVRRSQRNGHAVLPGSACTADPVNVAFCVKRHIVIVNVGDALYIQAACCNIGCDQNLQARLAEAAHDLLPFGLSQVAVQLVADKAVVLQRFIQLFCTYLCPAEHNCQIWHVLLQQMDKRALFAPIRRFDNQLVDAV
jgi:hypothetical protein